MWPSHRMPSAKLPRNWLCELSCTLGTLLQAPRTVFCAVTRFFVSDPKGLFLLPHETQLARRVKISGLFMTHLIKIVNVLVIYICTYK